MVKSDKEYIRAETFESFKDNQEILINILNHNMTEMKQDFKEFCATMNLAVNKMGNDISSMKASSAGMSTTLKWIMGVFSAILITGIIGAIF